MKTKPVPRQKTLEEIKQARAKVAEKALKLIPQLLIDINHHEWNTSGAKLGVKAVGHFYNITRSEGGAYMVLRHHLSAPVVVDFLKDFKASLNRSPDLIKRLETPAEG